MECANAMVAMKLPNTHTYMYIYIYNGLQTKQFCPCEYHTDSEPPGNNYGSFYVKCDVIPVEWLTSGYCQNKYCIKYEFLISNRHDAI